MKKKILAICSAALCAVCTGFVTACEKYVHEHDYGTAWEKDAAHHWHECRNAGCDNREADKAAHADNNGDGKCDVCEYVLFVPEVPVASVTLNKTELSLEAGEAETLIATVLPENATERAVAWESGAPEVAAVDGSGRVTAVAPGKAKITATADGNSAACTVTVTPKIIAVTGITLNKTETELEIGETETLIATVLPENATDKTVTFSVAPAGIVSVEENGVITAVKEGTATITAASNGKTAECTVTVTAPITNADIVRALDTYCKEGVVNEGVWLLEINYENVKDGKWHLSTNADGEITQAEYTFYYDRIETRNMYYAIGKVVFETPVDAKDFTEGKLSKATYSGVYKINYIESNQAARQALTEAMCETAFETNGTVLGRFIVDNGNAASDVVLSGTVRMFTVIEVTDKGVQEAKVNIKTSKNDAEYISKLAIKDAHRVFDKISKQLTGTLLENNNEPFLPLSF